VTIHVLTQEQQDFAAEHHDLVYDFLRDNRLHQDEFYDVIIFGYLRAVQKYLIHEKQRRQYEFSKIARQAMERDLAAHRRATQSCTVTLTREQLEDILGSQREYAWELCLV